MTTADNPQRSNSVVPGASAARARIWRSDTLGVIIYGAAAGTFFFAALLIVGVSR